MSEEPRRYRSLDEDSARWAGFEFRDGDIVISTRSKHGTTWVQMICALLVFGTSEFPAPLGEISPWLDWLVQPRDDVLRRLATQGHRRVIKTHTPLDGVPLDARATYVVVARHPLDAAVSLYHQGGNLDRERLRELTGEPGPRRDSVPPLRDWLSSWIDQDAKPEDDLDSLPGVMWHLSDAWVRRHQENVVLVHYGDLLADLDGEMTRLAGHLALPMRSDLVPAATFAAMRADADRLAPDPVGVLKDRSAFFRAGRSGAGEQVLSAAELDRYCRRAAELAPPDLLEWLHRPADGGA